MEYSTWIVWAIGIVAAFCIILFVILVKAVCQIAENTKKPEQIVPEVIAPSANVAPAAPMQPIANRKKILAAVCAVIAEENGCDVNAIRVLSFRKI